MSKLYSVYLEIAEFHCTCIVCIFQLQVSYFAKPVNCHVLLTFSCNVESTLKFDFSYRKTNCFCLRLYLHFSFAS